MGHTTVVECSGWTKTASKLRPLIIFLSQKEKKQKQKSFVCVCIY